MSRWKKAEHWTDTDFECTFTCTNGHDDGEWIGSYTIDSPDQWVECECPVCHTKYRVMVKLEEQEPT